MHNRNLHRALLACLLVLVGVSLLVLLPPLEAGNIASEPGLLGEDPSHGDGEGLDGMQLESHSLLSERVAAAGLPHLDAEGLAASATPSAATQPLAMLRGRVLSAPSPGRPSLPIAGAELRYSPETAIYMTPGEAPTSATTDEEGRFVLPLRLYGGNLLTIDARGFFPHAMEYRSKRKNETLPDVILAPASTVAGRVVDTSGRGIEGAKILVVDPCADDLRPHRWDKIEPAFTVTDGTGAFEVAASALSMPGLSFTLTALHNDYRPVYHHGSIKAGSREQGPVVMTMTPGAIIHGRVTGLSRDELAQEGPFAIGIATRASLEGIMRDHWTEDESSHRVAVRPDGTFSIGGLREGETVALAIWTGGAKKAPGTMRRSEWRLGEASNESSAGVELAYVTPVRIRARAVDAAGNALERLLSEAEVAGYLYGGGELRPIHEMADFPDGVIEWVCHSSSTDEPVGISIRVDDDEGAVLLEWEGAIPVLLTGATYDFGDVTLEPTQDPIPTADLPMRSVEVLVLDRHGHPLPQAFLRLAESKDPSQGFKWKRSNGSGRALFSVPSERDHWVRLAVGGRSDWLTRYRHREPDSPDPSPWVRIPSGKDAATLTLKTPETASVTFEVTYGGTPLPGATLGLSWAPLNSSSTFSSAGREATPKGERTDGAGLWNSDAMLPGNWTAKVYHPQLRMPEPFEFTLVPGEQTVRLNRQRTAVEGRVLDSDGFPIVGALVRPSKGYEHPVRAIHERDTHRMSPRPGGDKDDLALRDIRFVRTDASGYFRLEGVEPRVRLKAVALAPGFVIATSTFAKVDAGETVDLGEIRMEQGGRVDVRIPIGMEGDIYLDPILDEAEEDDHSDFTVEERWSSIFDAESVDGLRPGAWSLIVKYRAADTSDDEAQHLETLEILAGEIVIVDLRH